MNALICLHPGFEEIEATVPIDLLSRAGVAVTQASIGESTLVAGRSGITVKADKLLADCLDIAFDLVILPGGPGIMQIRGDKQLCQLLRSQANASRLIGCICAAPLLLRDAGLDEGRELVCHPSAEAELGVTAQQAVCVDGALITSRGAGTATEFGLALVEALHGRKLAESIAESICWNHPF